MKIQFKKFPSEGAIFQEEFFLGSNFTLRQFSGDNFPGAQFSREQFSGGNFPGGIFVS